MDGRVVAELLADILFLKNIICFEEYEAIMEIKNSSDVEAFTDKLIRGEFNVYKRGEHYSINNEQ